jgi:hypothetical protein
MRVVVRAAIASDDPERSEDFQPEATSWRVASSLNVTSTSDRHFCPRSALDLPSVIQFEVLSISGLDEAKRAGVRNHAIDP